MAGKIIGAFCCLLCAAPFFAIAALGEKGQEPLHFWNGDTSLNGKVRDVPAYNRKMASLYRKYAVSFLLAGIILLASPPAGAVFLLLNSSIGIYILFRRYQNILARYS